MRAPGAKARKQRRARWEALCTRCGDCCYVRYRRRGRLVIDRSRPCEFLDVSTRTCRVYEERFRRCARCGKVRLYHALFSRLLPSHCGYVTYYRKRRSR